MLPLWLYTLGQLLMDKANIQIPYIMLILNLFIVIVPSILGFIVAIYVPKHVNFYIELSISYIRHQVHDISAFGVEISYSRLIFFFFN